MEANELRIGNWVNTMLGYRKCIDVMCDSVNVKDGSYLYDDIMPIPLTPEILEKCGFLKEQGKEDIYRLGQIQLYHGLKTTMCYTRYDANEWCYLGLSTTSLHQLQNLFFSLTQTELNVEI